MIIGISIIVIGLILIAIGVYNAPFMDDNGNYTDKEGKDYDNIY